MILNTALSRSAFQLAKADDEKYFLEIGLFKELMNVHPPRPRVFAKFTKQDAIEAEGHRSDTRGSCSSMTKLGAGT